MADDPLDPPPDHGACPGSPRPRQAHAFVSHRRLDANTANDDEAPVLRPLPPSISSFSHLAQDAPHGCKHLQPHPLTPKGNRIPLAGTVFGSQGHPPPGVIFDSQPPYPTEIFHSRVPPPSAIFGGPPPPHEVVFGDRPPPGARFGSPSPSTGLDINTHPSYGSDCFPRTMHKCFALTSTRVYDKNLRCDRCGGRSDFGWYYRCSHETDARLFESIRNGNEEHFDEIGKVLSQNIGLPTRGPAARQDMLSPLNELPASQLDSLSAPQLAKVLRQHEAAVSTALVDRHGPNIPPADEKPFLMPQVEECRISLCPRCGRMGAGEQQSFLSLDGDLKGDVPPSAAVGFGFRALGGRPVANANIVKNLGLRDPKTGLLPGQKAKASGAQIAGIGSGSGEATDEFVGRPGALKVDDAQAFDDSEGPKTPAGSLKRGDSDEDLLKLYMDSEKDTPANSVQIDGDLGHAERNDS